MNEPAHRPDSFLGSRHVNGEDLRQSARRIRETVQAATPGPWVSLDQGDRIIRHVDEGPPALAVAAWLEDAAHGDDYGNINPYAAEVACAILARRGEET